MRDAKESTPRISCSERVEPAFPVRSRSSYIGMCPSGKLEARPNPPKIAPCKTAAPKGRLFQHQEWQRFRRGALPHLARYENYSGFFFKEESLVNKNPTRKMTVVPKTIVR